jgi:hypothetical protein
LAEIESELQAAVVDSPLHPLIEADDVKAARQGRGFDPDTVEIGWNEKQSS